MLSFSSFPWRWNKIACNPEEFHKISVYPWAEEYGSTQGELAQDQAPQLGKNAKKNKTKQNKSCSLGRETSLVCYSARSAHQFSMPFHSVFFPFFPHSKTWCQAIGEYRSTCISSLLIKPEVRSYWCEFTHFFFWLWKEISVALGFE